MKTFDVVIAGGAMAGGTLALAISQLSHQTLSVAVIEAYQHDNQAHPGFDSRAIALSHGTAETLKQFGIWPHLSEVVTPIKHIHVSDRHHFGMTEIDHNDVDLDALGYVVELIDVGNVYRQQLSQHDNITVFCPDKVEEVERHQDHVTVSLSSGETVKGQLLVAADGAFSTCSDLIGLDYTDHDFEQYAVIANVVPSEPHLGRAFERFTENGPIAMLPMSDNRLSLVWCVPADKVAELMTESDDEFLAELQQAFGWRLGEFQRVGQRANYPLQLRVRDKNISHRFAIVGNAGQTLHPIAGQGFNLGIRDVATLAEEITATEQIGEYAQLVRFQRRREQDRHATISLTSSLVHLFSNQWLTLALGRNLGLFTVDNFPQLKTPLLKRTLGIVNR
ncbi:2-octaprenyl-6-methoxyphenyl hydroxylase [Vibrio zhugei]|uniref:2-octaprenyl-6-methoxyphenyl hydroxylase n=1 Tax=Vibrio zhugei TaxID=2479546 RepID=A0ABV7C7V4_9VIBR|nr:2-octaprenyl-6-methoxyphenyl hydroxylase [Vibrio zhugei]